MAAYHRVNGLVTCGLTACMLHWNQLWAQRSVTSMGELFLPLFKYLNKSCKHMIWAEARDSYFVDRSFV